MHKWILAAGWVALTLSTSISLAAPAQVRLLQAPAWLVKGATRTALRPGQELNAGDGIITGNGARVMLTLSEGSLVKLGENAEFTLAELEEPADEAGIFRGFLNVAKGAFRFTTTVVGRKRDIRTQIRSATIGIRGTDVWGKAEDARDFVVLLEGKIDIEREGQTYAMDTPLTLFMAPRGQAALPIGPVDPDELARWAQETEPQAEAGSRAPDGGFRVNLATFADAAAADHLLNRLTTAGYAANREPASRAGRVGARVYIDGYASEADAQTSVAVLRTAFGLTSPWISRGSQ